MRYASEIVPWTSDPQEVANWFGSARLVIAMRLHAAVLASAYGTPCMALPYDAKVSEFASYANQPLLPQEELDQTSETAIADAFLEASRQLDAQPRHGVIDKWVPRKVLTGTLF
jgi:polysaccharide pyruvyl transferase WcaK-like protein